MSGYKNLTTRISTGFDEMENSIDRLLTLLNPNHDHNSDTPAAMMVENLVVQPLPLQYPFNPKFPKITPIKVEKIKI